jgi:predicted RNase H-like HicB family nuclease
MTTNSTHRPADYLILVEGGPPSNYSAWSPDLPGCAGAGDTVDDCVSNMLEAIALHLEVMASDGDPIPEPTGPGVYVERPSMTAA